MDEGKLGCSKFRNLRVSWRRIIRARLLGSNVSAKLMLCRVYSCVQYTFVLGGSAANLCKEESICEAVPSNSLPQPAPNNVSPQNRLLSLSCSGSYST